MPNHWVANCLPLQLLHQVLLLTDSLGSLLFAAIALASSSASCLLIGEPFVCCYSFCCKFYLLPTHCGAKKIVAIAFASSLGSFLCASIGLASRLPIDYTSERFVCC